MCQFDRTRRVLSWSVEFGFSSGVWANGEGFYWKILGFRPCWQISEGSVHGIADLRCPVDRAPRGLAWTIQFILGSPPGANPSRFYLKTWGLGLYFRISGGLVHAIADLRCPLDRARRVPSWYTTLAVWSNLWANGDGCYRKLLLFYLFFSSILSFSVRRGVL